MHDHHDDPQYPDASTDTAVHVELGPTLPDTYNAPAPPAPPPMPGETRLAAGMLFVGNAVLAGPCTVSGEVEGHLRNAEGSQVTIIVTEGGRVRGDISAQRIAVMGSTEGRLDAGTGDVTLHDGARVYGVVRYGRIRVDGADLNATLERVPPQSS